MQSSAELLSGQVVEAVSCECKLVSGVLRRGHCSFFYSCWCGGSCFPYRTGRRVGLGTALSSPCDPVEDIHLWGCLESGFVEGGNARTGILAQSRGSELRIGVLWLDSPACVLKTPKKI